jgi:subtilisin family serine protease
MTNRHAIKMGLVLSTAPLAFAAAPAQAGLLSWFLPPAAPAVPVPTPAPKPTTLPTVPTMPTPTPAPAPARPYQISGDAFTSLPADLEPKWGKIRSFWGKIRSFDGGEVSPFWGKIRSFWGDLSPFEGDTTQFWGNLQTFNTGTVTTTNRLAPEWGKIRSFWDELGTSWTTTRTVWDAGNYVQTASELNGIVDRSALLWGDAVKAGTGKDFRTGFANEILARHGIDPSNPSSLAKLDVNAREHFFIDWYDGLMQFSGADQPDYWMRMVNWSPAQAQKGGKAFDSVIGLLDFSVDDATVALKIKSRKGVSEVDNGHGAAVASLITAPHDGRGIMGMAPNVKVVAYNPFDETETAGWSDIKDGIAELARHKASIINMSLGVSGWALHPDWDVVLSDPAIAKATEKTVLVFAAGNDGIVQPQNIAWANKANFIVVGSVDPSGQVSEFSNRPGDTCLVNSGACDKLMNHFIVAPGEMMLVSDGHGGVTRYSGTSFAAPLVSGTAALMHDRWPWLANYPAETVKIIVDSARDLGALGTDSVYGVGMLDVEAALSPLDYSKLTWYQLSDTNQLKPMTSAAVSSTVAGRLFSWAPTGMTYRAIEKVGATYRDFVIPLSSTLVDSGVLLGGTAREQFQSYLYNQSTSWLRIGFSATGRPSLNYASTSTTLPTAAGMKLTMSVAPRTALPGDDRRGFAPFQTALRLATQDERFALKMGDGDGAIELGNVSGFSRASDYDRSSGGANPLLGMASGGTYAQATYALSKPLSVSFGVTQQDTRYERNGLSMGEAMNFGMLGGYQTSASTVGLSWRLSERLQLNGAYTRLREDDAILGVQSLANGLLGKGATTQGVTLAATYQLTSTLQASGSATMGQTTSASSNALVATGSGGLRSSAYQFTLAKQGLVDRNDALRVSISQPLHVERGSFDVSSVQVIDRSTGELGLVTESFALAGTKPRMMGELQYARSIMDGQGDIALFGKAQLRGDNSTLDQAARVMAGASLRLRY